MNLARSWLAAAIAVGLLIFASWMWVDRPLALWVHSHQLLNHEHQFLTPLTRIPDPLIPAGAALYVLLGARALMEKVASKIHSVATVCCLSVIMTETVKNGLKWFFGRSWPDSWRGNPSFVRDHDYSFHWFHGASAHESFPSGHMAAAVAALSVLWIYYPRLRPLYATLGCLLGAALVLRNFHFLSDVLAGAFLGALIANMSALLFENAPRLRAGRPGSQNQPGAD